MLTGSRWPQRPPVGTPIDGSHPLSGGLVAFWPGADSTGGMYNAVGGASYAAAIGAPVWQPGPYGLAPYLSGTSQYFDAGPIPALNGATQATVICAGSYVPGENWIIGRLGASGSHFGALIVPDGTIYLCADPGNGGYQPIYGYGPDRGQPVAVGAGNFVLAMVLDLSLPSGSLQIRAYLNGHVLPAEPLAGTPSPVAISDDHWTMGVLYGYYPGSRSAPQYTQGRLDWCALWSGRALDAGEVASFSANPWVISRRGYNALAQFAARTGPRVSYPRGFSTCRPVHLTTADFTCYLD